MELFKSAAEPSSKTSNGSYKSTHAMSQQHVQGRSGLLSNHTSARKPSSYGRSSSKHSMSAARQPSLEDPRGMNIKVFARFRPMNRMQNELTKNGFGQIAAHFSSDTAVALEDSSGMVYSFDRVLEPGTSQKQVFETAASQTVRDVLNGYNGTIIAYGQTGSGKTYTMVGDAQNNQLKGIIPRSISEIFGYIEREDVEVEFKLTCSILEIYRQNLYDLLSQHRDLKIKQSPSRGVYVEGLAEFTISTERQLYNILEIGEQTRRIASTRLNENSSRSHTLFILDVRQLLPNKNEKFGRLNLVDLAGSEKVAKTGAVGETLEEAKKINFSLSCLGNVIHALTNKNDYIPYRDSKLTRILSESLGGNYRTSLIVTCSSHSSSLDETISTLKFATRAKNIKNTCRINVKNSPEEMQKIIAQLRNQVVELKLQLESGHRMEGIPKTTETDELHEEAHQTVRNTSRLRMVKNPFQRGSMVTSTAQPQSVTNREGSETASRSQQQEQPTPRMDSELHRENARLKTELAHQRLLSHSLKEQLAEYNRTCSFTYREQVKKASEVERVRLQELCLRLQGTFMSGCSTPLKDWSNVRMTPRSTNSLPLNDPLLRVINTFPEDLQKLYIYLKDNLVESVSQLRNTLEYVEAVKQNFPDHIAKYLQGCLSQQLDRSVKSQKLVESVVLKEAVKHNLTSLQLIHTRNSFSVVLEEAYLEALSRNQQLVEVLERRLHEERRSVCKGINLTESHHLEQCVENSETIRLIDSNIESQRNLVRLYDQSYESLKGQLQQLKETLVTLDSSIREHLAVQSPPSTPPPTMKNDCASPSPLRRDYNRMNPKTPPKGKEVLTTRSVSQCKELLLQSEQPNKRKSMVTIPLQENERPIQFRYQHYYA